MKLLPWCFLLVVVLLYLSVGGAIFMFLEQPHQLEAQPEVHPCPEKCVPFSDLELHFQDILEKQLAPHFYENETAKIVRETLQKLKKHFVKEHAESSSSSEISLTWDYYNSVVYAFTIVTTIGFGHLTPNTDGSRVFAVFYGLVGIPLHMILVRELGEYFSRKLEGANRTSHKMMVYGTDRLSLLLQIIYLLIPGLMTFVILPAGLFVAVENWSFAESVYFAGITLMTIGFGDYVPGKVAANGNVWLWIYKIFIFIWIEFGLGYLMMILGFVTRVILHKNVRRLVERKLLNFLSTETATNEELLEDVEFLQRVMGEPHLLNVKKDPDMDPPPEGQKCQGHSEKKTQKKNANPRKSVQESFALPTEILAAVVKVLIHGVIQEVIEGVDDEGPVERTSISELKLESGTEKRRRKILENKRKSLWYLDTLTEAVLSDDKEKPEQDDPNEIVVERSSDRKFVSRTAGLKMEGKGGGGPQFPFEEINNFYENQKTKKIPLGPIPMTSRSFPYRQKHMNKEAAKIIHDFSRMLDALHSKLKPIEIELERESGEETIMEEGNQDKSQGSKIFLNIKQLMVNTIQ